MSGTFTWKRYAGRGRVGFVTEHPLGRASLLRYQSPAYRREVLWRASITVRRRGLTWRAYRSFLRLTDAKAWAAAIIVDKAIELDKYASEKVRTEKAEAERAAGTPDSAGPGGPACSGVRLTTRDEGGRENGGVVDRSEADPLPPLHVDAGAVAQDLG